MNTPRFCISVPVGAYHPLLLDCLRSLAIQNPKPQVALMDASGDPRVSSVADMFEDLFAYRHHGPDKGQTDAIKTGWSHLEGDVLGWLNADDVLFPDALKHACEALVENPDTALVYGHSQIVNEANQVTGFHWNVAPPSDAIQTQCIISQPSCFFRREAYDDVGGLDSSLHYTMDWDLWVKLYNAGGEFVFIDRVMSKVLWTSEAKTGGFGGERRRELRRIIDQNPSFKQRVNSYVGFASHHLLEYVVPKTMKRKAWRRNTDGGQGLFGLSVGGAIPEEAHIPMVHYIAEPQDGLELEFEGDLDALDWRIAGQTISVLQVEAGVAWLRLDKSVPPGEAFTLNVIRCGPERVYLNGARFCSGA